MANPACGPILSLQQTLAREKIGGKLVDTEGGISK